MKHLYPDFYMHSISELSAEFFLCRGITHVIFDIDDTLVAHGIPSPDGDVVAFLHGLKEAGLTLGLISNSKKGRAERFNETLGLFCHGNAKKPSRKALAPFFEAFSTTPAHVALVGDQLFTDVWLAAKWGVFSVLVDPISPYENPFFYLKRALEKPILRSYFKHIEEENRKKD